MIQKKLYFNTEKTEKWIHFQNNKKIKPEKILFGKYAMIENLEKIPFICFSLCTVGTF